MFDDEEAREPAVDGWGKTQEDSSVSETDRAGEEVTDSAAADELNDEEDREPVVKVDNLRLPQ